jgi:hypothetical protein
VGDKLFRAFPTDGLHRQAHEEGFGVKLCKAQTAWQRDWGRVGNLPLYTAIQQQHFSLKTLKEEDS